MKVIKASISGCYLVIPDCHADYRGKFVKTFHEPSFQELGFVTDFRETYYSTSRNGVLRGLHFQTPPYDHTKLVHCSFGTIFDAVLDLRSGSPTYGKFETYLLNDENQHMLYIAPGLAHGFYTMSKEALVMYQVTTVYDLAHDGGVKWDSAGIPWPCEEPVVSERDQNFPPLREYTSPFLYG